MKNTLVGLMMALLAVTSVQAGVVIAQDPLFISAQADPRVMLVLSRDHQLFIKAYTDYSDLDGDGYLDTTFTPYIEYDGYFNPQKCYSYSSTNNRFEASGAASAVTVLGTKTQYQCSSAWSGNFLNWATMTRMDLVRKVLYGGYRSTDDTNLTVLERAHIPDDIHSFVKIFAPAGDDAAKKLEMAKFTPYSTETSISLCNTTRDGTRSRDSTEEPEIYVARGVFENWAAGESGAGEKGQCQPSYIPAASRIAVDPPLIARVKVCDATTDSVAGPGPKCKTYTNGTSKKPIGLLQQYGDPDAPLGLRFGLLTGTWGKNKDGGVLRKNIGLLSNSAGNYQSSPDCTVSANGFNASDEVNFCTGQFVNNQKYARSASGAQDLPSWGGIIGTINRFRISGYQRTNYSPSNCGNAGVLQFSNGTCSDWGNPLSEMYLETLNYLRAGNANNKTASDPSAASPTANFNVNDSSHISGLPQLTWKDPIPLKEWCAKSNILILSTGLNSFDTNLTAHSFSNWTNSTNVLTDSIASSSYENLSGDYLIGSNTGEGLPSATCSEKNLGLLSNFSGVCPEVPNLSGSYHIAGLALGTALYDLRPGYKTYRNTLWGSSKPAYANRQPLNTFTVALAENMPEFNIPVGSGIISIVPSLQAWATDSPSGPIVASWQSGSIADLRVLPGTSPTKGSIRIVWENAAWGSDYDQDAVHLLHYCIGSDCNGFSGFTGTPVAGRLYVKLAIMATAAGRNMRHGISLTGSTTDGYVELANGTGTFAYNASNETTRAAGSSWTYITDINTTVNNPVWRSFTPGSAGAKLLKNPLWYTAKYAAWPDWDTKLNNATRSPGADTLPDNFFEVRNPAGLDQSISAALKESLADSSSSSSIATNSTRLDTNTYVYQARFKATDWSGQVLAFPVTSTGALGGLAWDASCRDLALGECWADIAHTTTKANAEKFPKEDNTDSLRKIFTYNRSATPPLGIDFRWSSLAGSTYLSDKQKAGLDNANIANPSSPYLTYLRGNQVDEKRDTNSDGTYDTGLYRPRLTSLMGDIINSDPVFVGAQDFLYRNLTSVTGYGTYGAHVAKKLDSSGLAKNPIILVNANDGMMHAIDARNGNEIFSYVPSWLLCADETGTSCTSGNDSSPLRNLLNPNMTHRYLLDGNLVAGDACFGTTPCTSWKTVVVGAAAAGGKGIFALDVTRSFDGSTATTSASSVTATQTAYAGMTAANTVMWEFTDKDYLSGTPQNGDVDLGYTYGQPVIARMRNGEWAAIFGNGYGSATGKAVLYMVKLDDGTLIKKIDVGDGSTTSPNGLSSPAVVFDQGTGAVKVIFAGDLKGNLWKFDVSSTSTSSWGVDNVVSSLPVPLFTAFDDTGNRQPITGGLDIGAHPSGGYMVYFGTGKYFEKNDNTATTQHTLYGIWDKTATNDQISYTTANKATVLQSHSILFELTNPTTAPPTGGGSTAAGSFRVTDDIGTIDWTTKRGWYMNLQTSGDASERVVTSPILRNGRVIFTTMIPSPSPCEFGGTSWIMELDPTTGNRPSSSVFDLSGDGTFTNADYVLVHIGTEDVKVPVTGVKSTEGIIKSPAIIAAGGKEYKIASGTTGNVLVVKEQGTTTRPRPAWRQLQ